jgi:DNA-binding transcriptional ArsR family regulator
LTIRHFENNRNIERSECGMKRLSPSAGGEPDALAAVEALSALAHPGRLAAFRRLVRAGPPGLAAGDLARAVGAPPSTLSSHLNLLAHAGLVTARREGRSIVYAADFDGMRALLGFLIEDCCDGAPEICAPLADIAARAAACCAPAAAQPQTEDAL